MAKIGGIASVLGILLAIIAGFVTIPGLNVALVILILGIIGGIAAEQDNAVRMFVAVAVFPMIGTALGAIPGVGANLTTIFGGLATLVAGASATLVARRLYEMVTTTVTGLSSGSN